MPAHVNAEAIARSNLYGLDCLTLFAMTIFFLRLLDRYFWPYNGFLPWKQT